MLVLVLDIGGLLEGDGVEEGSCGQVVFVQCFQVGYFDVFEVQCVGFDQFFGQIVFFDFQIVFGEVVVCCYDDEVWLVQCMVLLFDVQYGDGGVDDFQVVVYVEVQLGGVYVEVFFEDQWFYFDGDWFVDVGY